MRAACYIEPGKIQVLDVPKPEIAHGTDILVKVKYCAICGDDKKTYQGVFSGGIQAPPYIIGHEMSGTIVELGKDAILKNFSIGDKVTGNFSLYCGQCEDCMRGEYQLCGNVQPRMNAMAEYVVWDERQLYKIPQEIPLEQACLTEPLTSCLRAIEVSGILQGEDVAIFGAGGIGLMLLQLALLRGAARVVVFEPNEKKRDIAKKLGAYEAIDPQTENVYKAAALLTKARGFPTVIEASGNHEAVKPCFEIMARGGVMIVFAVHNPDYCFPLNLSQFYLKDATLRSVYNAPSKYPNALHMIPKLNLEYLVNHIFTLNQIEEAFDSSKTKDMPKVIVKCDDSR